MGMLFPLENQKQKMELAFGFPSQDPNTREDRMQDFEDLAKEILLQLRWDESVEQRHPHNCHTRGYSIYMGDKLLARNLCHTECKYFKTELTSHILNSIFHFEKGPRPHQLRSLSYLNLF